MSETQQLLEGLTTRAQLVDLPLSAFRVKVSLCSGAGECAAVCMVRVFSTDRSGRCVVVNDELCFGCMACVAQCADHGVTVEPRSLSHYPLAEDLLR